MRDPDGTLNKLVTPRVVAKAMREYASAFSALEELEHELRSLCGRVPHDAAAGVLARSHEGEKTRITQLDLERLTYGDYQTLLGSFWDDLGLGRLNKKMTLMWLKTAGEFRNAVAHFRPDPVRENGDMMVRRLLNVLRR